MRNVLLRLWLVPGLLVFGAAGCFNDAFRGHEFGDSSVERFALVIEPDRTLVDGTHFLVDRATGDLWRLDVSDRRNGAWVRLAEGPADAAEIQFAISGKDEEDSED